MAESPNLSIQNQETPAMRWMRDKARALGQQAYRLVNQMRQLDPNMFSPDEPFYFHREADRIGLVLDGRFNGMGTGDIAFWHFYRPNQRITDQLGVFTMNQLSVGLLTDNRLAQTCREYTENGKTHPYDLEPIETNYFIDTRGNYAKISGVPLWIPDDREEIRLCALPYAVMSLYKTPMTPRDLVLAQNALEALSTQSQQRLLLYGIK